MKFIFDTHGGERGLKNRAGPIVTLLRGLAEKETDNPPPGGKFRLPL